MRNPVLSTDDNTRLASMNNKRRAINKNDGESEHNGDDGDAAAHVVLIVGDCVICEDDSRWQVC
jgi:hypothetical protein